MFCTSQNPNEPRVLTNKIHGLYYSITGSSHFISKIIKNVPLIANCRLYQTFYMNIIAAETNHQAIQLTLWLSSTTLCAAVCNAFLNYFLSVYVYETISLCILKN